MTGQWPVALGLWLIWIGLVVVPVAVVWGSLRLADKAWPLLCSLLRARGWDIATEEPPAPPNL